VVKNNRKLVGKKYYRLMVKNVEKFVKTVKIEKNLVELVANGQK
jgi:hypothetical protein